MYSLSDLANLGTPEIIETLDAEAVLAARKAKLLQLAPSYGLTYDTLSLESEPGLILLQEASYEETVLRARGNDIARDAYLYFSRGAGLAHLAAFYDVTRLPGEADDRLKARVILAVQGRSPGGTKARYKSIVMGSSLRVADVEVYRDGLSPVVNIAVFASDNNGVADTTLLNTVRAAVNDDAVRMISDTLNVRSAVVQVVPVTADVWLMPSADVSILTTLQNTLAATWAAQSGIGRDLTVSWLISAIMVSGVQRVVMTSPLADIVMRPYEAVRISTVTLTLRGRDF